MRDKDILAMHERIQRAKRVRDFSRKRNPHDKESLILFLFHATEGEKELLLERFWNQIIQFRP